MKILHIIFPIFVACGVLTARGEWKLKEHEGQAIILDEWDTKSTDAPSIKALTQILALRDKSVPLKHITFDTYFNNDSIVQGELLKQFWLRHSGILAEALKSSGNMHNPKVLPLRSKFSECLLKTPSLTKINEALLAHGYSVKSIEFEKFSIDKEKKTTPFHAGIWLILEPNTSEEPNRVPGSD